MKLDTSHMRYLEPTDWKVLATVAFCSKKFELVPTSVIQKNSRLNMGGVGKSISTLAKHKLITKLRNAKYDGYKLTFNGSDYLALRTMLVHGSMSALGTTVGVGKESDIYSTKDDKGNEKILKIHRLGRTSFRTIKSKRDYLKKNTSENWMGLSMIAAKKEYDFLKTLHEYGFNVPEPYDYARHCILMEWVQGYPMTKLYEFYDVKKLYSELMKFIVKLANHGLIHCDFNEFNIMIRDDDIIDSEVYEDDFVVLDFPQSVSIDHVDAQEYFDRDVECVKRFFKRRFSYEPEADPLSLDTDGYGEDFKYVQPDFVRDVKRVGNIDELLQASGFKKSLPGAKDGFEDAMGALRGREVGEDDEDVEDDIQDESEDDVETDVPEDLKETE